MYDYSQDYVDKLTADRNAAIDDRNRAFQKITVMQEIIRQLENELKDGAWMYNECKNDLMEARRALSLTKQELRKRTDERDALLLPDQAQAIWLGEN